MADLLIVASPTTVPLCTDVAVPSDGQPQWGLCSGCGTRYDRRETFGNVCRGPLGASHEPVYEPVYIIPDGPFPFRVARWAEVERCPVHDMPDCSPLLNGCSRMTSGPFGAVTHLVEVTGPSHHADDYGDGHPCVDSLGRMCHPDALPDCWHTPTGTVTVLDEPVPCERPRHLKQIRYCRDDHGDVRTRIPHDHTPGWVHPSVWVADRGRCRATAESDSVTMILQRQYREVFAELWRIAQMKPWLFVLPVTIMAWVLQRGNPDLPMPWWLRFDTINDGSQLMESDTLFRRPDEDQKQSEDTA